MRPPGRKPQVRQQERNRRIQFNMHIGRAEETRRRAQQILPLKQPAPIQAAGV